MGMKIIKRIVAVLFPIMLILSAFVILKLNILPARGIQLTVNTTGTSIEPTIKEGCLAICDENVPFEDIQVGDIICFRERSSIMSGSASAMVTFTLAPTDSASPTPAPVDASREDADVENTEAENPTVDISSSEGVDATDAEDTDEGFVDTDIRYTGNTVMHRVVEINENSDRALITEGDGNGYRDQLPVMKSGYIGKYIFYMNYIGWPLRILTNKWVFSVLGAVTLILLAIVLIDRIHTSA